MNGRPKLRAVNIVTADPVRLAEFYRDVLGADICLDHGGPQRIEICLDGQGPLIVANGDPAFTPRAYDACQGFELYVEDADAQYRRLCALGIDATEPCDLPWGYRYFHIKDPDGNGIDLVQKL